MDELTRAQAVILSGFTGIACCPFSWLHEDVERRLATPVFTHQFASKEMEARIKELYRADFLSLCPKAKP